MLFRKLDCVSITDSVGHYRIDVAIKHKLKWDEGMKDIVDAFSKAQGRS